MKGSDVSQAMPDNPCPDTPTEEALESLLAGQEVPTELQGVADVLAALATPATEAELSGEAAALTAFREAMQPKPPASKPMRTRLTVVAILGALGLGSTAAYAGVLPERAQTIAHHALGAPAPVHDIKPPRVVEPRHEPDPPPTQEATTKPWRTKPLPTKPLPPRLLPAAPVAPVAVVAPAAEPAPPPGAVKRPAPPQSPIIKPPFPGRPANGPGARPQLPPPAMWKGPHKSPLKSHPHGGPSKGRPGGKNGTPPGHR